MINNQFETILKDLEAYFKCPLAPDSNNSCLIEIRTGIQLQIELDSHNNLIMGVRLGVLPQGRFRENILREALKANNLQPFSSGTFAFIGKSGTLILFVSVDSRYLNIEKLTTLTLPAFLEKAAHWKDSLERGEIPSIIEQPLVGKPNLFGLIH